MYIIYIYRIRNYVYVFELICDLYDVLVFLSLPSRMLQTLMFCVFWSVFWSDSFITITFIPPDGEFELMRYRVTQASQPFRLIPTIREEGKTKLLLNLKVQADFQDDRKASSVVIKFPVPTTTASARISVSKARNKLTQLRNQWVCS